MYLRSILSLEPSVAGPTSVAGWGFRLCQVSGMFSTNVAAVSVHLFDMYSHLRMLPMHKLSYVAPRWILTHFSSVPLFFGMSLIQMALECVLRLQMFSTNVAEVTIIRREVLCLQMILSRGFILADFFTDEADEARSTSRVAAPKVLLGKRVEGQTWCDGPIGKCPAPPQSGNECTNYNVHCAAAHFNESQHHRKF